MTILDVLISLTFMLWGVLSITSPHKTQYFKIGRKRFCYNKNMQWLFIVVVSSFFLGSDFLSLSRISFFTIICIFAIFKKNYYWLKKESNMSVLFILFYVWLLYTMTYSEGITQGLLMLIKYIIPVIFFLFSYYAIQNEDEYFAWFYRINVINLIYICIHGIAPIGLVIDDSMGWKFMGGEHGYYFAAFLGVPLTLYVKTGKKKYLFHALLYSIPSVTYIRRAAFGAFCIVTCLFCVYRYKLLGTIVIGVLLATVTMAVFYLDPVKERVFGGDKGDASSITLKDFEQGEAELNSSGREVMWGIVLNNFYKGNEIKGSGLGTMKNYLISENNEYKETFLILHNDYLHLLCETGIVGVGLWILFLMAIAFRMLKVMIRAESFLLRYSAFTTLGSFMAISFIMYYANVVSTPFLFIQPFILLGFHIKLSHINYKRHVTLKTKDCMHG